MDQHISSNCHFVFTAIEAAGDDDDDDERNVAKECGAWAWAGPQMPRESWPGGCRRPCKDARPARSWI